LEEASIMGLLPPWGKACPTMAGAGKGVNTTMKAYYPLYFPQVSKVSWVKVR